MAFLYVFLCAHTINGVLNKQSEMIINVDGTKTQFNEVLDLFLN